MPKNISFSQLFRQLHTMPPEGAGDKLIQLVRRILLDERRQTVNIKKLDPDAILPEKSTGLSAGFDVHSIQNAEIPPHQRLKLGTGLAIAIPKGYHIEIRPRSGLALHHGITVLNTPGTVDADYRGELQIVLINHGDETYKIQKGDRIAQILLMQHTEIIWNTVDELDETPRGTNGWGHSGI